MTTAPYDIRSAVQIFRSGREIPPEQMPDFFDALLAEQDDRALREILTEWTKRGFGEDEIFALASLMRARCISVRSPHETFADIVGTGGSSEKTFNVSTAGAFVAAGAGVPVAKHGNRAATSNTGSADVLSALGVQPAGDAATAELCLTRIGVCFMFAPNFHRLSPVLARARRQLGFPTIFNILGPLCNPAGVPMQLIGVWSPKLVGLVARVVARLGTRRTWVVCGSGGFDEITLSGTTEVAEINNEIVTRFTVAPADIGISPTAVADLKATTPEESASRIREVLAGSDLDSSASNLVLFNAAAAIHIATGDDLISAYQRARVSISSGAARGKLNALAEMTNK